MPKKETTQKQIRANRKNALKSTGPKTPNGKGIARWNALDHGLLSKEVVITAGPGKENGDEYRGLLTELREDLQPTGILEEMLVERIATSYWRHMRALRYEVGEIQKGPDEIRLGDSRGPNWSNGYFEYREVPPEMWPDVLATLEEAMDPESFEEWLRKRSAEEPLGSRHDSAEWSERSTRNTRANLEHEAQDLRMSLPDKEAVDKILRNETAILRQFNGANNELERLQRRRRGDIVPPPINVGLSTD